MEREAVQRVVDAYFTRMNAGAFDRLAPLFAADAELVAPAARRHGREAIVAYYPRVLAGFSAHRDTPTRVLVDGPTAVVEIRFDGTLRDGRAISFDAVDVFDLEGGEVRRLSIWYDSAAVLRDVGPA